MRLDVLFLLFILLTRERECVCLDGGSARFSSIYSGKNSPLFPSLDLSLSLALSFLFKTDRSSVRGRSVWIQPPKCHLDCHHLHLSRNCTAGGSAAAAKQ